MNTLTGLSPCEVLPHGPTKLLVDEYLWHAPDVGIVAAYTPNARDVHDHFGVFRAVDQVESFGQATVVSCSAFLDTTKMGLNYEDYYKIRNFVFVGVKSVHCHDVIRCNETYVCLGVIDFYKYRQMTASGRIYKIPATLDLHKYFSDFSGERLRNYDIDGRFVFCTEIHSITSKGIRNELLSTDMPDKVATGKSAD